MDPPAGATTTESAREVVVRFERFTCRPAAGLPPILEDLDLEIYRGECVFVLGASGAGKTALGLSLNGVIPRIFGESSGSVSILGRPTAGRSVAELATSVGIVFQDVESQLCTLRVRDEIAFGPENLRLPREEVLSRVRSALAFVGLERLASRSVFELSGGEKQKLALAALLAMEPEILFLDEPAANLDPRSTSEVATLLRRLKREKTLFVFENKVDEFLPEADRLLVFDHGRLVLDGPPRAVLAVHGKRLMEQYGVWIPAATELALALLPESARTPDRIPLTVEEAVDALEPFAALATEIAVSSPEPPAAARRLVAEVSDVSYRYGGAAPALDHVSLTVDEGEWLGLLGPNGSGKTTLSKHLVGLLRPQSGTVKVLGYDTKETPLRVLAGRVRYVFQNPEHQFVQDTVADELRFSLRWADVPVAEQDDELHAALERFGLVGLEKRHPYSLSAGEKRRLSVATMLVSRPRVLILDEPTFGLDRRNTEQVMAALRDAAAALRAQGDDLTVLLVTHDMRLVADHATSVAVMAQGKLRYRGSVPALFADDEVVADANLDQPRIHRIDKLLRLRGRALSQEQILHVGTRA